MMLEFFQVYLPILIYVLLIILLVVSIILGVRLLGAMDKVDAVLDNAQKKINSLNGLFNVIDFTTDKISAFSDRLVDLVSSFVGRLSSRKRRKKESEEDYE